MKFAYQRNINLDILKLNRQHISSLNQTVNFSNKHSSLDSS